MNEKISIEKQGLLPFNKSGKRATSSSAQRKYRRFAKAYAIEPNATKAAILAGYSRSTAHVAGSRLLKHAEVQRLLHHWQKKVLGERAEGSEADTPQEIITQPHNMRVEIVGPREKVRAFQLFGKYLKICVQVC